MQSTDIPAKFSIPFGNGAGGAFIRTIPLASQVGIQDGAASLTTGFPPLTMNPVGTPPFGQDFNGILFESTSWDRWFSAGGPLPFDAAFSTAIGGYPKGAIVASATTFGYFWRSTAENNTTDPDAGGAGWLGFTLGATACAPAAGFKNLRIANGGTPNNQMTITADSVVVENAAGLAVRLSTVSVTPDITASGANGLDTGAVAPSTWYSEWVLLNPTTGTVAGLFSLSTTAPTLPAGYTFKARVGWARTDAASHLYNILQNGRIAQYIVGGNPASTIMVASGVAGTFSNTAPVAAVVSVAGIVPPTASRISMATANTWKGGTAASVLVAPNAAWFGANNGPQGSNGNVFPIWLVPSPSPGGSHAGSAWMGLESTSIAWCSSASGGAIGCIGWEDNI